MGTLKKFKFCDQLDLMVFLALLIFIIKSIGFDVHIAHHFTLIYTKHLIFLNLYLIFIFRFIAFFKCLF